MKKKSLNVVERDARNVRLYRTLVYHEATAIDTHSTNYKDSFPEAFKKVKLSHFDGNNSIWWLARAEKSFHIQNSKP